VANLQNPPGQYLSTVPPAAAPIPSFPAVSAVPAEVEAPAALSGRYTGCIVKWMENYGFIGSDHIPGTGLTSVEETIFLNETAKSSAVLQCSVTILFFQSAYHVE
jgi:hypothetical protein